LWVLIGSHSGHRGTQLVATFVPLFIWFTHTMEGTRLSEAATISDYWYVVAVTALISDFLIYWATRFL